jgi:allantoinase
MHDLRAPTSTTFCLRGRRVLLASARGRGLHAATLHIKDGVIVDVTGYDVVDGNVPVVDAGDLVVGPGVVDSHVHINEPGRTEWEGFQTATEAAAAGGITCVVDMPLNCIPATTSRRAAEAKLLALEGQVHVDVAFWGGVVPGNVDELKGLAEFGVPGAKCFTCPSGVDEFPNVVEADLDRAMPVLRDLGVTLLVHAEHPAPLAEAEALLARENADPRAYQTYLRSRPRAAEDAAIAMVIALARKHRCPTHIVHLSSASALPLLKAAQADGVPITAETCLHYLAFTSDDVADGETRFKCAPPIREPSNREDLWRGLFDQTVNMVVSDHSPCTPALKKPGTGDFMGAWGGIAGLQLGLSVLHTTAKGRGHGLAQMAEWNSEAPARLAGLADKKGKLMKGFDADIVVWDDAAAFVVDGGAVRHKHKVTPYAGRRYEGVVEQTYVRGRLAYARSTGLRAPRGTFQPARR